MDFPYGIDVSSYQGDAQPDDSRLQNRGFCIVKASEGVGYINPNQNSWVQVCKNTGRKIGSYHFMRSGSPGDQVRYYLNHTPNDLDFYALDMEDSGDGYDWIGRALFAISFCTAVAKERGKPCVLYVNRSWANELWNNISQDIRDDLSKIELWLADYTGQPGVYSGPVPNGWNIVIHQYTSTPIDTNLMIDDTFIQEKGEPDMQLTDEIMNQHGEIVTFETMLRFMDSRLEDIARIMYQNGIQRPYADLDDNAMPDTDVKTAISWDAKHYFDLSRQIEKLSEQILDIYAILEERTEPRPHNK